jgi:enoyl-CoA hydratase/carnithine racemase
MGYENLLLEHKGSVCVLSINHPPANAVNYATLVDMDAALDEVENERNLRALIITGAGEKGFCAGFDATDFEHAGQAGPKGQEVWTRVDRFPKPVIAAINGFAFGGGCELALACHFRLMADAPKAKIGLTELNLGIIPGWGGTQRMTSILGKAKALELILLSRRLTASEALEIGLVNQVCAPDQLMSNALELAGVLAERPPIAVRCTLEAITACVEKGLDEGLKVEATGRDTVSRTKDAQEGFSAFLEKRKPEFTGE